MKKILIRPRYLFAAMLVAVTLAVGTVYLVTNNSGPKLTPAQKESQEKLENFSSCLEDAKKVEGGQSAVDTARAACLEKYPES